MPLLNNIAIFALYIICFVSIFKSNTETIGFYLLFVINSIAGIYILQNNVFILKNANFVVLLSLFTILFYLVMHSVGLLFIILTISTLNLKYSNEKNIPLRLSDKYQKYLDDFKLFMTILFSFSFVLLVANYTMGGGDGILNSNYYNLFNAKFPGIDYIKITILTFITLMSMCVLGLTSYNFYLAFMFSKLRQKELL
jgi:hypothetical protein